MERTPRLGLPFIAPQQAQKQVTYNDAMRALDVLVQPAVTSRSVGTPPSSPATGDSYIVGASPTGAWTGNAAKIATWDGVAWNFRTPADGWLAYVLDDAEMAICQSGAWSALVANGYEEGSWTPALTFDGTGTGITYGAQAGRYTKTGRMVLATASVVLTSKGSATGAAAIEGLPFAPEVAPAGALSIGFTEGLTLSGQVAGLVTTPARALLYASLDGGNGALTDANFSDSSALSFSVVYDAA